jgi:NADH:ubiquinone oxidoreductase subunit F (NADH-binding)
MAGVVEDSSFFHLAGVQLRDQQCQGTACFVARHRASTPWARTEASDPRVYCLGQCHAAPAAVDREVAEPAVAVDAGHAVILERAASGASTSLDAYRDNGGYRGLERAVEFPNTVLDEVVASGLRGRGGAGFPTGRKWRAVAANKSEQKYVIANADEGDAGAYIDRVVLERDPHAVLEGLAIAAISVGATRGFVYVRKEYPKARQVMAQARDDARGAGVLGPAVLGSTVAFDVEVVDGQGSYVCGEETALLNAFEGRRPEVRVRPPYPAERGLFDRPTLVNNVETLASIPWIVRHGGDAYASMGTPHSTGTKVVSLNSLFRRPGLYEVEFGLPVRDIVERLGGGLADGDLAGVLIGGPLAGVLPPSLLDTPFDFEALRGVGCEVGHGGIVAFDERTSILELAHHVFRFAAYESCGKCTPCRVGSAEIEQTLQSLLAGESRRLTAVDWVDATNALVNTSLCGHGGGLGAFAASLTRNFDEDVKQCLA